MQMRFSSLLSNAVSSLPANRSVVVLICLLICQSGTAQDSWYKIELSIFTNEDQDERNQELWRPGQRELDHPDKLTRLSELADLLLLDSMLPEPAAEPEEAIAEQELSRLDEQSNIEEPLPPSAAQIRAEAIAQVGPTPKKTAQAFKFFDPLRDPFFKLPAAQGDFTQTNRAINRSADHRLLFHAVWQQPVNSQDEAKSILIEGGDLFGDQAELQGNLTIRFNESEDRVVLDADIWLTEFAIVADSVRDDAVLSDGSLSIDGREAPLLEKPAEWVLPSIPESLKDGPLQILQARTSLSETKYKADNVFHMLQSRPMRSNEFHYVDHPALGIVVLVQPYEIPPLPVLDQTDAELSIGNSESDANSDAFSAGIPAN